MGLLSREQILGADDVGTEDVEVPEWGGSVRVRGLSGAERDAYEASLVRTRGKNQEVNLQNVRAKLVAWSVIDENGERLFAQSDVKALGEKSASALDRVWEVARKLSRLSDEDVEELAEGFDDAQSDGDTSD